MSTHSTIPPLERGQHGRRSPPAADPLRHSMEAATADLCKWSSLPGVDTDPSGRRGSIRHPAIDSARSKTVYCSWEIEAEIVKLGQEPRQPPTPAMQRQAVAESGPRCLR